MRVPLRREGPLIPRYNRADTSLSKDEREAAIDEYVEKHGVEPAHVGATKDDAVLVKLWRKFPNAVPSISCGPSKLVVLDADKKDAGPEKLRALFEEHEGLPAGAHVNPTKSGVLCLRNGLVDRFCGKLVSTPSHGLPSDVSRVFPTASLGDSALVCSGVPERLYSRFGKLLGNIGGGLACH
ncbi:bifunctional DNA primase/polymerase [Bradyrhizobium septentrionale]|uniref:bifunctional DNA primase/polymerase n=1 Tax=Bradyrhizobium septentrionale TaxID=1404411 RepID=UPI003B8A656E